MVAHLDDADEAVDELEALGVDAVKLAAMEVLPGESSVSVELVAERLRVERRLIEGMTPGIVVAPIQALMQPVPQPEDLGAMMRSIGRGDEVDQGALLAWLDETGYSRAEVIEHPGDFAVRGGIIDVFPPGQVPVRIDLFGDEVDGIWEIDLATMGSDRRVDAVDLVGATLERLTSAERTQHAVDLLPPETVAVLAEVAEITEQGRGYFDRVFDGGVIFGPPDVFKHIGNRCSAVVEANQYSAGSEPDRVVDLPVELIEGFSEHVGEAVEHLAALSAVRDVIVLCQNAGEQSRMAELLEEHAPDVRPRFEIITQYLHRGFCWGGQTDAGAGTGAEPHRPVMLVPYHELLNRHHVRRRIRRLSGGRTMDTFLELQVGDYVVHRDHGIALFKGLKSMPAERGGSPARGDDAALTEEYLTLEFASRALLHVPASKIDLVQKYIGGFHGRPRLSTLGGKRWKKDKEKVAEAVRDLASEMLRIQAAREASPGITFPDDTPWQYEFEAEFPYDETDDQLTAIAAVKRDMIGTRPMDRLICGDVGFGKTEVAIRAAFKAAEAGRQVAILAPTTVLVEQHERTFRQRFKDYPFRIESISRFKSRGEQDAILKALAAGRIDVIIGTHRLLSADVTFAGGSDGDGAADAGGLGLVIIDEEQRFGVEHKQRLLSLRMTADVMTLTATPIPRTLHMAMLGLRDISALSTPPPDRRAIVTEVIGYNEHRIRQALQRELARQGQVFFVHNRVHNIQSVADDVRRLVPDARVIVGHGQMAPRELEKVMLAFIRGQADVLVCTTIIESGIDIPTANTMFINNAHMFGLSELHQLRGRVGRYKHRAYCYMLLPQDKPLSEVAIKRLRAIESYSMLGAGFQIALRDLEIRGAGNLLGSEQSGHIAVVGYDMYCRLLEHAVRDLKRDRERAAAGGGAVPAPAEQIDTSIEIGLIGSIPRGYIPSDQRRMEAYRRISAAASLEELHRVERDMTSAYGDVPRTTRALLDLAELRMLAAQLRIRQIVRREGDIILRTRDPMRLQEAMAGVQGSVRLVGQVDADGMAEVYFRPPPSFLEPTSLVTVLRRRFARACEQDVVGGSSR